MSEWVDIRFLEKDEYCNLLEVEPKHESMLWKEANAEYYHKCYYGDGHFSSCFDLRKKIRHVH